MIDKEKFKALISDEPSGWLEKAEWRHRNNWWLFPLAIIQVKYLHLLRILNLYKKGYKPYFSNWHNKK